MITMVSLVFPSHHTKLQNVQHNITDSSHHAVYYIAMTDLFYDWNFVPLDFLHPFAHPPTPPLATANLFSESLSVVFKIPHISEIIWCLSF